MIIVGNKREITIQSQPRIRFLFLKPPSVVARMRMTHPIALQRDHGGRRVQPQHQLGQRDLLQRRRPLTSVSLTGLQKRKRSRC